MLWLEKHFSPLQVKFEVILKNEILEIITIKKEKNYHILIWKFVFIVFSGDELSSSGYESIEANINCISNKKPSAALTSFSNPNYLCPDAKTVVEKKQQKNKFGETIIPPICQLSRDESHQNFAAALNSPAESLISDYQVFAKKNFVKSNSQN